MFGLATRRSLDESLMQFQAVVTYLTAAYNIILTYNEEAYSMKRRIGL